MQRKTYLMGFVVLFGLVALCTAGFLNSQRATANSQTASILEGASAEPVSFTVLPNPAFYEESIAENFGRGFTAGGIKIYKQPEQTEIAAEKKWSLPNASSGVEKSKSGFANGNGFFANSAGFYSDAGSPIAQRSAPGAVASGRAVGTLAKNKDVSVLENTLAPSSRHSSSHVQPSARVPDGGSTMWLLAGALCFIGVVRSRYCVG